MLNSGLKSLILVVGQEIRLLKLYKNGKVRKLQELILMNQVLRLQKMKLKNWD